MHIDEGRLIPTTIAAPAMRRTISLDPAALEKPEPHRAGRSVRSLGRGHPGPIGGAPG